MPTRIAQQSVKSKVKKKIERIEEMIKMLNPIKQMEVNHNQQTPSTISNPRSNKTDKEIEDLLRYTKAKNLLYFRKFAINGGLLKNSFRASIWPVLAENLPRAIHLDEYEQQDPENSVHPIPPLSLRVGFNIYDSVHLSPNGDDSVDDEETRKTLVTTDTSLEELRAHDEWNQIELDVRRTLDRFPPNIPESKRHQLQQDLILMIVELLHENSNLRYYQGFHDVCLTFILVLNLEQTRKVIRCLINRSSFRNYMTKALEETVMHELELMYVILYKYDHELERKLRRAELGTLFALSWPITWFSHALHSFDQITLCFDLFLSSDALMPIYVCAALIVHRRAEIFDTEPEMSVLHRLLNQIPETLDVEAVLRTARKLYDRYRPALVQEKYCHQYSRMCALEKNRHLACSSDKQSSHVQSSAVIDGVTSAANTLYRWFFG